MIREILENRRGHPPELRDGHHEIDRLLERIAESKNPSERDPFVTKLPAHANAEQERLHPWLIRGSMKERWHGRAATEEWPRQFS